MPALAEAIPAPGARGLAASIHDLKLRDGRKVTELIGGNIVTPPKLVRTIEGATNLVIEIVDPELRWLDHALASTKWTCTLDGLAFRYVGTSKPLNSTVMTLTFEDETVARLREVEGPIRVYARRGTPEEVTLAEFIISLVELAPGPPIPWRCPQIEEKQPIENQKQAAKAKKEAAGKRDKGIGDTKGLTVKGEKATPAQIENGEMVLRVAASRSAPSRAATAVMVSAIVETLIGTYGPGLSNILEAEGAGIGADKADAATQISNFLIGKGDYPEGGAIGYFEDHPQANPYEIAQAMQRSGAGHASNGAANYGPWVDEAREWVETFDGGAIEESGSVTITKPRYFYVAGEGKRQKRKPETGWDAIQRYAKAVNWRAFADLGTFCYFDEEELSRGEVRLAIVRHPGERRPENEHVEDVGFDADEGKPVTECTVSALASKWGAAPGAVVTVAGYGPASIGPGDPPVQNWTKAGKKIGISSAVKASTHEGKGRYLNVKTEVPLIGAPAVRKATISLRKPTRPLPEKASETSTLTVERASAEGNATVERVLEALENAAALENPYVWGGEDPDPGVDCSGCVSFALRIGGFMEGRTTTQGLATFGEAGKGELITVYDHANTGDPHTEHCAIEVAGVVFESGGGSENTNPNGGLGKVDDASSFLEQFEIKRHPKGF